jgi:prepilin-type N-terminal cleavage/methylation domain-containing protein
MTDRSINGFTMLEVLIAMSILAVALIALATLATTNLKATESAKRLTQGLNIAMEKMEVLKAIPYPNIQSTSTTPLSEDGNLERTCIKDSDTPPTFTCTPTSSSIPLDDMPFTWKWTVTYVDLDNDGVFYSGDPVIDPDDIKRVDLAVDWTDIFGVHTTKLTALRSKI